MTRTDERVEDLTALLDTLTSGVVPPDVKNELERLLARCWNDFRIEFDGGMEPWKVINRTEKARWEPPVLTFIIERHGAAVMGSVYAELQEWTVNLDTMTATCDTVAKRQVAAKNAPLKLKPIAEEIAGCILRREAHPHLTWLRNGKGVRVNSAALLGGGSFVPKQTAEGRRQRFQKALALLLEPHGWLRRGTYWQDPKRQPQSDSAPRHLYGENDADQSKNDAGRSHEEKSSDPEQHRDPDAD